MGPSAIRYAGLEERLAAIGVAAERPRQRRRAGARGIGARRRAGPLPARRSWMRVPSSPRRSSRRSARSDCPLVLGGDHSVAIGTLSGHGRRSGPPGRRGLDRRARRPQHGPRRALRATSTACRSRPRSGARRRTVRPRRARCCPRSMRAGSRSSGSARSIPPSEVFLHDADPRLHDERHRPDRDRARRHGGARPGRGAGLRPCLARPRCARPGGRPRSRNACARRAHLPGGAPRLRADRGVRASRARSRSWR